MTRIVKTRVKTLVKTRAETPAGCELLIHKGKNLMCYTHIKSEGKDAGEKTRVETPARLLDALRRKPDASLADVAAAIGKSLGAAERARVFAIGCAMDIPQF